MSEEMDPAQAIELAALRHQNAMNSVMDRGDSPIQLFYKNSTVFVTGSSGFLGKQLIEKLFRSCKIKKMFLLIRSKKGKTIQERLEYTLTDPVFDGLHSKQPSFVKKLVPVEGDVGEIGLGMSQTDRETIIQQVDMIFHLAATVRFDEPIRAAVLINVRGTMEMIKLARECKNLRNFVYVSTSYAQARSENIGKELAEKFYPCPVPPDVIIGLVESLDEDKLKRMTPALIHDWPNTYTFTKTIAEEVVRTLAMDLPICVVKPPIVACSYCEPTPGWLDLSSVFGTSGVYVGLAVGTLHVLYLHDTGHNLAIVPVDIVNNAIIAAGWDSAQRPRGKKEIIVYNVANGQVGVSWQFMKKVISTECINFPSPKAIWYCYLIEVKYKLIYNILFWLLQYIPAYFMDGVCFIMKKRPMGINSFVKIFKKVNKMSVMFHYFYKNPFLFKDDNVTTMISKMSSADKKIYNCDIRSIDYHEYIKIWLIGIRKYVIKDGLKNSANARRKQQVFRVFNHLIGVIYLYVIWCILSLFWRMLMYVI